MIFCGTIVTRRLVVLCILSCVACASSDPDFHRDQWPDLAAHVRPTVMKDLRERDTDLLGWQERAEAQRKEEQQRIEKQPKVTAAFVDLPVRDALFEISTQTKISVIVDQTVSGTVTINLHEVPFETALRFIVFAGNYSYATDGTSYFVGSIDPTSPNYARLTMTRVIPTNAPPKELVAALNKAYAPYLSFNEGKSSLTLTGPGVILDRIEADVHILDRPPLQIQIEVLIVETKLGNEELIGLDYDKLEATLQKEMQWNFGVQTLNQFDLLAQLALTFDLMAKKNLATIRSHPKVVTTDGTPAEIKSLVESYVLITRTGLVLTSAVEIIRSGTTLKVTPRVTRNDEIELTIEPEVADVIGISTEAAGSLPVINRRSAKSVVRVRNGDVVILGGLYEENMQRIQKGLPFLKDIPVVNLVVGKKDFKSVERELLIFVSPKVIK